MQIAKSPSTPLSSCKRTRITGPSAIKRKITKALPYKIPQLQIAASPYRLKSAYFVFVILRLNFSILIEPMKFSPIKLSQSKLSKLGHRPAPH